LGSAEFPAFGTLRLVCEFLKKGRRLLRSGSLIAALLPTSLPINQTPGNGDTEAGGLGPSSPSCSSIQGAKASWLLMASKVSFARNCVFFTFPYQVLPPTFDWLAAYITIAAGSTLAAGTPLQHCTERRQAWGVERCPVIDSI